MNKYLPYEEIIAQKLQELPTPDVNMSLWGNISKKIRLEEKQQIFWKQNFIKIAVISAVLISIIIFLLSIFGKKKSHIPPKKPSVVKAEVNNPDSAPVDSLIKNKVVKNEKPVIKLSQSSIRKVDSTQSELSIFLPLSNQIIELDSLTSKKNPDSLPVLPQLKKSKGVTGISDSDYKLIIKRDSS